MDTLAKAIEDARKASDKLNPAEESYSDALVRRLDVRDTLAVSGLPSWSWCSFGTDRFESSADEAPEMVSFCLAWKRIMGSAILSGPTGVGKTVCMVALGRRLIGKLDSNPPLAIEVQSWIRRVRFIAAEHLVRAYRQHPLGKGSPPGASRAETASLLLLDNLGNESQDRDAVIFELIDQRYMAGRPTIMTTHLDEREMRARYGDALVRRIVDHGTFVIPGATI